eukprot:307760-Hanusia_phi.AAC.1
MPRASDPAPGMQYNDNVLRFLWFLVEPRTRHRHGHTRELSEPSALRQKHSVTVICRSPQLATSM